MSRQFLPFLYQTRTLHRALRPQQLQAPSRALHGSPLLNDKSPLSGYSAGYSIPFEHDPMNPEPLEITPEDSAASTITPQEQRIFGEIFADIERKGRLPRTQSDAPTETGGASPSMVQRRNNADAGEAFLLRYPPTLRDAARRALRMIEPRVSRPAAAAPETTPAEPAASAESATTGATAAATAAAEQPQAPPSYLRPKTEEEKAARRQLAQTKRDAAMRACKTDKDLWALLETEVFALYVTRLKIDDRPSHATYDFIETFGPVYASSLLLATKLLGGDHFGRPSPLVFNVKPRIEEFGVVSYVLGATTALCNEWLELAWRLKGDLYGVTALLKEMEQNGLGFDKKTLRILEQIEVTLKAVESGERGGFSKALLEMPEYDQAGRDLLAWWTGRLREAMRGEVYEDMRGREAELAV